MNAFSVTVRNEQGRRVEFSAIARSSFDAAIYATELFGDEPCKVNVKPLTVAMQ